MSLSSALEVAAVTELRLRPGPKATKATPERFNEAVKTFEDRLETPTVEGVRLLIGGKTATIAKWLMEREKNLGCDTSTVSFPESLAKALRTYAADSVANVAEKWKRRYDEVCAICASLEKSCNEAEGEREILEYELEQLRNERHRDAGRDKRLCEEMDSKNLEIAALRTQLLAEQLHASRADDERAAVYERLLREEAKGVKTTEQVELLREEVAVRDIAMARKEAHLEHAMQRNKEYEARRQKGFGQPTFDLEDGHMSPLE